MEKEYSAGAVVFRKDGHVVEYLLVYSGRNNTWGLPKGHIEPGEKEKDATLREIAEEAGIRDMRFIDGFREEITYTAKSNRAPNVGNDIEKNVVYFLCEAGKDKVVVDNKEITDYEWVAWFDVDKVVGHDDLKLVLKKATTYAYRPIPKEAVWHKVAINQTTYRYVLDITKYGLPYYEDISVGFEDFKVEFVIPEKGLFNEKDMRKEIGWSWMSPYYNSPIEAIKVDAAKRGLPIEMGKECCYE